MKTLSLLLVAVALCAAAVGGDVVVTLHDTSPSQSPLASTGTITLSESSSQGMLLMSHSDAWDVMNRSSKPIVAIVSTAFIQYANGQKGEEQAQYDAFFHYTLLDPGVQITLSSGPSSQFAAPASSLDPAAPSCEVVTRWVEFSDGTTYGDAKYASELLKGRKEIKAGLQRLEQALLTGGPDQFAKALQQTDPSQVADAYIGHLRHVQSKDGTSAAIAALQEHLQMVRLHTLTP